MKKDQIRTQQMKQKIFEQIEWLLNHGDFDDITFAQVAKLCGCQPNSITYYFKNKMDMLLQFTQYHLNNDASYRSTLCFTPSGPPTADRFCREIDGIFSISQQKSKIRLLSNFFLISNASLSFDYSECVKRSVLRECEAMRSMIEFYHTHGILCGDRLRVSFAALCFQANALSLFHIFNLPYWNYETQVRCSAERLKAAFLPAYVPSPCAADGNSATYPLPADPALLLQDNRYLNGDPIDGLQKEIFDAIARLLEADRINDITFNRLAELCYCQPSSIAYYFKNKMDMLVQFTQYYLEITLSHETAFIPPLTYDNCSDAESFSRFIDRTINGFSNVPNILFWINYIVVCNLTAVPKFYDYMDFSIRRKINRSWTAVQQFRDKGIVCEDNIAGAFSDLCFISDALAMMHIFQVPITDREFFLSIVSSGLKTALIKPEYLTFK